MSTQDANLLPTEAETGERDLHRANAGNDAAGGKTKALDDRSGEAGQTWVAGDEHRKFVIAMLLDGVEDLGAAAGDSDGWCGETGKQRKQARRADEDFSLLDCRQSLQGDALARAGAAADDGDGIHRHGERFLRMPASFLPG